MTRNIEQTDEWIKENVLRLAEKHFFECENDNCQVSLLAVFLLLEKAGFKLTEAERANLL